MSESAISNQRRFEKCCTLNDEGALLVSDYFLRENVAEIICSRFAHTKKINYLEIAKEWL